MIVGLLEARPAGEQMQVLGDLVELPTTTDSIPLPWWHRAPLGLQTGTQCYVSLVKRASRPVGDVIVSVLEPGQEIVRIDCEKRDGIGVVANAIRALEGYNIELAESATVHGGARHPVTLICTPVVDGNHEDLKSGALETLKQEGFAVSSIAGIARNDLFWTRAATVEWGWIHGVRWSQPLVDRSDPREGVQHVDLKRAVVSADTQQRLLRFVFPRKGARTVLIEHRNRPGILARITDILSGCGLNMLSFLLRRGGAQPGNNVLVAVCEPGAEMAEDAWERLAAGLAEFPHDYQVDLKTNEGLSADRVLAPSRRDAVIAPIPPHLVTPVRRRRRELPQHLTPVFLSRRVQETPRSKLLVEAVRQGIQDGGGTCLEVNPRHDASQFDTVAQDVATSLWVADRGIALISDFPRDDIVGGNMPQEIGFLQGQAKQVLVLVQSNLVEQFQRRVSNLSGIWVRQFGQDEGALDAETGVRAIVKEWMLGAS